MSALAGLVVELEALRLERGYTMREVGRLAGRTDGDHSWYRNTITRLSGPILDRINAVARVYGYRLALVPIEQEETAA